MDTDGRSVVNRRRLVSTGSVAPEAEYLAFFKASLPLGKIFSRPLAEVLAGHQHAGATVSVNLGGIDPSRLHRVRDRGDERLIVERAGVIGLWVEEHGVLGAGIAAEPRPEGLALALEEFSLRRVEANSSSPGPLPSRDPAPEATERRAPDQPPNENTDKTAEGLATRAG